MSVLFKAEQYPSVWMGLRNGTQERGQSRKATERDCVGVKRTEQAHQRRVFGCPLLQRGWGVTADGDGASFWSERMFWKQIQEVAENICNLLEKTMELHTLRE